MRNGQTLDARNLFAVNNINPVTGPEIPGSAVPEYIRNQFGFAVGGPIRKDKTFFFASCEGLRQVQGESVTGLLPTAAQKVGDFNSLLTSLTTNLCGSGGSACLNFGSGQLFNPASQYLFTCPAGRVRACSAVLAGQPISGNVIQNVNPVAKQVLTLYPAPNSPGILNYVNQTPYREQDNSIVVRVDESFSAKDQLFAHYLFADSNEFFPGDSNPFNIRQTSRGQNAELDWTHRLAPGLLNELRVGVTRGFEDKDCADCPHPARTLASLGIQGVGASTRQTEIDPSILLINFGAWGDCGYNPHILPDMLEMCEDTLTKIKGRHTVVMGRCQERQMVV